MNTTIVFRTAAAVSALGLALSLSACGTSDSKDAGSAASESAAPSASQQAGLTLSDGWVKAVKKDHGMTAVFGVLKNESDKDIHFTAASSPIAAKGELHETVKDNSGSSKMQEKKEGFTIPAGGELKLEPGGNHIMLMQLKEGIEPGAEVEVTLTTDAGDVQVKVPAKEFAGAKEEYKQDGGKDAGKDGHEGHDHGDHDHGDHDHGDHEGHNH